MSPQLILIILATNALISAAIAATLASAFGRDGFAWGFLGLIFGIFAIVMVAMMGRAPTTESRSGMRLCPACCFEIPSRATRCGHCTSGVEPLV